MNTVTGRRTRGARLAPAVACLWLTVLCIATAQAEEQPRGTDLQLEHTPSELLGAEEAARYRRILDPDRPLSWDVYYPAVDGDEMPGVLVYISPGPSGRIDPRWRRVMDEMKLIYIAANDSGNRVRTNRRMVLAVFALRALNRRFEFDPSRIRVAGFSGGGRVASLLASQYPEAFTGALYICGVDFWKKSRTRNVERLIRNRFVFLTGPGDFNQAEMRRVHQRYLKAGAGNSKLMVIPGMGHELPDAAVLTRTLAYLAGDDPD